MNGSNRDLSYGSLAAFAGELDDYCFTSNSFFSERLLRIISECIGYDTASLSRYVGGKFLGVETISDDRRVLHDMKRYYLQDFVSVDPFATYISNNFNDDFSSPPAVIKSADAFGPSYHTNPYFKFLSAYDFGWALSMPIGEYRITLYKHLEESDFSSVELDFFIAVASMIGDKYRRKQNLSVLIASMETKKRLLDDLSMGYILLDEQFRPIECNETGTYFISDMTEKMDIAAGCQEAIRLLDRSGKRGTGVESALWLCHKGYKVQFKSHVDIHPLKGTSKFYTLTIKRESSAALFHRNKCTEFSRSHGLSERECEVAELLTKGVSYEKIAVKLFISINTVRTHIRNIYKKLDIDNQRTLVSLYEKSIF